MGLCLVSGSLRFVGLLLAHSESVDFLLLLVCLTSTSFLFVPAVPELFPENYEEIVVKVLVGWQSGKLRSPINRVLYWGLFLIIDPAGQEQPKDVVIFPEGLLRFLLQL